MQRAAGRITTTLSGRGRTLLKCTFMPFTQKSAAVKVTDDVIPNYPHLPLLKILMLFMIFQHHYYYLEYLEQIAYEKT